MLQNRTDATSLPRNGKIPPQTRDRSPAPATMRTSAAAATSTSGRTPPPSATAQPSGRRTTPTPPSSRPQSSPTAAIATGKAPRRMTPPPGGVRGSRATPPPGSSSEASGKRARGDESTAPSASGGDQAAKRIRQEAGSTVQAMPAAVSGMPTDEEIRAGLSAGPVPLGDFLKLFGKRLTTVQMKKDFKLNMLRVGQLQEVNGVKCIVFKGGKPTS